ncbi:MAG: hypothetical protein ACK5TM_11590 [Methylobacterium sp.]
MSGDHDQLSASGMMMVLMMIISTVRMGIVRRHQGDFDALS